MGLKDDKDEAKAAWKMLKAGGASKKQVVGAKARYLAAAAAHAAASATALDGDSGPEEGGSEEKGKKSEKKKKEKKKKKSKTREKEERKRKAASDSETAGGVGSSDDGDDAADAGGKRKKAKTEEGRKEKKAKGKGARKVAVVDKAADKYRAAKDIVVEAAQEEDGSTYAIPSPAYSFDDAPFCPELVAALKEAEFAKPTAVQAQAWTVAAEGKDVVCLAKTGSGKTAAFLLPTMEKISRSIDAPTRAIAGQSGWLPAPVALVLAPTRELAMQIQEQAVRFGKAHSIRSVCVFGGVPVHQQLNSLKGGANAYPHLVVATPGRLIDLEKMNGIILSQVATLVLDEADRMLDMGFSVQLDRIVASFARVAATTERQTLLFSATWPEFVKAIAGKFLTPNAVTIKVGQGRDVGAGGASALVAHENITQTVHVVDEKGKQAMLRRVVRNLPDGHKTLVFVRMKSLCDKVSEEYKAAGNKCDALHGNREQVDRTRVVKEFKATSIDILFATDVAARGLDITDITHVINFDFPVQRGAGGIEDYVHRVGRTGRAGRKGSAITFFTREDGENAGDLVALLKKAKQVVSPALEALAATASSAEAVEAAAAKRQRKKDEKLSKKAIRSGDWRCKKCGSNVFATKDKCFKCKAPKPAE